MVVDKAGDFRKYFSEAFATTFGQKFPKERPCFDYMWSLQDECWMEWTSKVPAYQPIPIGGGPGETPFSHCLPPTQMATTARHAGCPQRTCSGPCPHTACKAAEL